MSEPINQIPKETLAAATEALIKQNLMDCFARSAIEAKSGSYRLYEADAIAVFEAAGVLNLLTEREQLTGDLKIVQELYRRLRASILPASCEIHPRFSVGCSECRLVQMAARIEELQSAIAERDEVYQKVITGECAPDEVHCPCVPHLMRRIGEAAAAAKPIAKVYHLWQQDFYVDENGRTDPPSLVGTFSSLDALNVYAQQFWFDLIVDVRGKQFASNEMRFEGTGKQYGAVYVAYCDLDPVTN